MKKLVKCEKCGRLTPIGTNERWCMYWCLSCIVKKLYPYMEREV